MQFKVGDKVKISDNRQGHHSLPIGTIGTISNVINVFIQLKEWPGLNIPAAEVSRAAYSKNELKIQRRDLLEQLGEIDTKLDYIEKAGLDEFDPLQYKIYRAVSTLKNTDNLVEASLAIAQIIKDE